MVTGVTSSNVALPAHMQAGTIDLKDAAAIIADTTGAYSDDQKLATLQEFGYKWDRSKYTQEEAKGFLDAIHNSKIVKAQIAASDKFTKFVAPLSERRYGASADPSYTETDFNLDTASFFKGLSDPLERKLLNADAMARDALATAAQAFIEANGTAAERASMRSDARLVSGADDARTLEESKNPLLDKYVKFGEELYRQRQGLTFSPEAVIIGSVNAQTKAAGFAATSSAAPTLNAKASSKTQDIVSLSVAARAVKI